MIKPGDVLKLLTCTLYMGFCAGAYVEMAVGWWRVKAWVYAHETLVGSLLAVASALLGAWFLSRQTTQQRRLEDQRAMRRREATRAVLPLALASLNDYAAESASLCKTLLDLCDTRRALQKPVTVPLPPMPALPAEAINVLRDLIEWAEERHISTLSGFIADIQVQHSRIASTLAVAKSGDGPIITTFNLEEYVVDCAIVHARASSLFDYARRRALSIAGTITWGAVLQAVHFFDMDDFSYPSLHALITRRSNSNAGGTVETRWRTT